VSTHSVYDEDSFLAVVSAIRDGLEEGKHQQVKITDKRSLDANAQVWVWIPKISEFEGLTIPEVEKKLKHQFGLPILKTDLEAGEKINFILRKCGYDHMPLESQQEMIHFLPVTRLFSTKQHNSYRDAIQIHYAAQGLNLEYLK